MSRFIPIVLALHTVLPIVCAPFLFGEVWPASGLLRTLLGGGIVLATTGSILLASSASDYYMASGYGKQR